MGSVECRPGQGVPWGLGMGIPIQTTQSILLQPSDPQAQLPNAPMASKQTNPPTPRQSPRVWGWARNGVIPSGTKRFLCLSYFPQWAGVDKKPLGREPDI